MKIRIIKTGIKYGILFKNAYDRWQPVTEDGFEKTFDSPSEAHEYAKTLGWLNDVVEEFVV